MTDANINYKGLFLNADVGFDSKNLDNFLNPKK